MAPTNPDTKAGFVYAISAYVLWGGLPIYLKALSHVGATELLAHRIVWSVPFTAIVLLVMGRGRSILEALRSPRTLAFGALTATLLSINWLTYIWAVLTDRTVDAALGYYINPLFSVFLGAVVLRERLSALKWVAVALAALAVTIIVVDAGRLPWIALTLSVSWGFYALSKRALPVGPNVGFMLEVLVLAPVAAAWIAILLWQGTSAFAVTTWDTVLLVAAGPITAIPLLLYANGAKGLTLSTIALLQYIAPSLILLVAVVLFREEVDTARRIAFPIIWLALAVYSVAVIRERRPPSPLATRPPETSP